MSRLDTQNLKNLFGLFAVADLVRETIVSQTSYGDYSIELITPYYKLVVKPYEDVGYEALHPKFGNYNEFCKYADVKKDIRLILDQIELTHQTSDFKL